MAKIKTSALIADIKGTVGGNVFSANKGGNYVRRYKKPTNLNSLRQNIVRSRFGDVAQVWRTLTADQRTSWNEGTANFPYTDAMGDTKLLSGQQLFNKLNNALSQAFSDSYPLLFCPSPRSFPTVNQTLFTVSTVGGANVRVSFDFLGEAEVPTGYYLILNFTGKLSAGVSSPAKSLFKFVSKIEASNPTSAVDVSAAYRAVFGNVNVGDAVFIEYQLLNVISGELSAPIRNKAIVTLA